MKTLPFITLLLLFGCTQYVVKETITTKTDTLYIPILLPQSYDTLNTQNDSLGFFGEDVQYKVRVDTLWKKIFIVRKPIHDTVRYAVHDTTILREKNKDDSGFFGGITLKDIMIFISVIVGISLIVQILPKK